MKILQSHPGCPGLLWANCVNLVHLPKLPPTPHHWLANLFEVDSIYKWMKESCHIDNISANYQFPDIMINFRVNQKPP